MDSSNQSALFFTLLLLALMGSQQAQQDYNACRRYCTAIPKEKLLVCRLIEHDNSFSARNHIANYDATAGSIENLKILSMETRFKDALETVRACFALYPQLVSMDISGLNMTSFSELFDSEVNSSILSVHLKKLNVSQNDISHLPTNALLTQFPSLIELDISYNPIISSQTPLGILAERNTANLSRQLIFRGFSGSILTRDSIPILPNVTYLDLADSGLESVDAAAFHGFDNLIHLGLANCPNLYFISALALESHLPQLRTIDLSNSAALESLDLSGLQYLTFVNLNGSRISSLRPPATNQIVLHLSIGHTSRWDCTCPILWITASSHVTVEWQESALCSTPSQMAGQRLPRRLKQCSAPVVHNFTDRAVYRLGSRARLECRVSGKPYPDIVWVTPGGERLVYRTVRHRNYPSLGDAVGSLFHAGHTWHGREQYDDELADNMRNRLYLLSPDGSLFIDYVTRRDPGSYSCLAVSPLGNVSRTMVLELDYDVLRAVRWHSQIVGMICSGSLLGLGCLVCIYRFFSIRCSKTQQAKKRSLRTLLESIETFKTHKIGQFRAYRSQQVERLRDSYTAQVQRIKDFCITYTVNMQDNYNRRIARIKQNCEQRMEHLRESYNMQMTRIKDYKASQVERIREHYNQQIIKIREYASSQLEKLRDQYHQQQQTLIKILEAMNFEQCVPNTDDGDSLHDPIYDAVREKFLQTSVLPMPDLSDDEDEEDVDIIFGSAELCSVQMHTGSGDSSTKSSPRRQVGDEENVISTSAQMEALPLGLYENGTEQLDQLEKDINALVNATLADTVGSMSVETSIRSRNLDANDHVGFSNGQKVLENGIIS